MMEMYLPNKEKRERPKRWFMEVVKVDLKMFGLIWKDAIYGKG